MNEEEEELIVCSSPYANWCTNPMYMTLKTSRKFSAAFLPLSTVIRTLFLLFIQQKAESNHVYCCSYLVV